jgi:hypothetical protein
MRSFPEWKVAPQRGHHTNQDITLPNLSSTQPAVCVPTRARSRGQTEEHELINQALNIKSVTQPEGQHDWLYTTRTEALVCCLCQPRATFPTQLEERGVTGGDVRLHGRVCHSMEVRRRREEEIERPYDDLFFDATARIVRT